MQYLKKLIRDYLALAKSDISSIRLKELSRGQLFFIRPIKIVYLAARRFFEDKCPLRASALTYYTLISIVPVVATAFGIAKGFGLENNLEGLLRQKIIGHDEVLNKIISFSHSLLDATRGGVLTGVGVVILLWSAISILNHIEESFDDIWGVKEQRPLGKKFSDYLSLMFICPVVLIVATSLTVSLTTHIPLLMKDSAFFGVLNPLVTFLVKLLPYALVWALFVFVYVFMPHTKVTFSAGLVAGVIAGTIYQVAQWGYIVFQIASVRYNTVYGSFAALPLFLIWLQLSWLIVLFGAELSYAYQNIDTYEYEGESWRVNHYYRKLFALEITHLLVKNFARGDIPLTATQIAHALDIPIPLVNEILGDLLECRLVSKVKTEKYWGHAYQPARDIGTLTIGRVIDSMEKAGSDSIILADTPELQTLAASLHSFGEIIDVSPSNKLLKDL